MKRGWIGILVLVAVSGFSVQAGASLTTIGTANYGGHDYNLIYETGNNGKNLVWLDYSHFSPRDWWSQMAWAIQLNSSGVLSYNLNPGVSVTWNGDWRLPVAVNGTYKWGVDGAGNTSGFNITSAEMGYLYQNSLGNQSGWDSFGTDLNKGPFENLEEFSYWTGTEYLSGTPSVWRYTFEAGAQELMYKAETWPFAMAVRTASVMGDIPDVPEPSTTVFLLVSGVVGLMGARRRFKKE